MQRQRGVEAGQVGLAGSVKACAGNYRTLPQQVDVGACGQADAATVVAGGDGAALEQRQAGASGDVNGGIDSVIDAGKDAGGTVDRMAGRNFDQAVTGQCLDRAALVCREAVDLITIGDETALARALCHADIDQGVGNRPAHDQHLILDHDRQFVGTQSGIGRAIDVVHVLTLYFQGAGVNGQALARLCVAHDLHAVGQQHGVVIEPCREGVLPHDGVFNIAHAHQHANATVADIDTAETVGQGRHIAHAQVKESGRAGG